MISEASIFMNGCASDSSDDTLEDVLSYLKKHSSNGVAVNGILVWMDIQQNTTPPEVWQAQADYAFEDGEIDVAQSAAGARKDIIGEIVAHRSPGKKRKNLEDIYKAMSALKDNNAMPLPLGTSPMVKEFPPFHCDKETMNITDVMTKIKVVEQSLGAFIKQNNEQFKAITDVISNSLSSIREVLVSDTPSKRRKVSQAAGVDGVTPLSSDRVVSFSDMARRTINRPRATQQQQQMAPHPLQEPFTNQHHLRPPRNPATNSSNNGNRRRSSALVFGNGTASNDEHLLSADINLVASGVSKQATSDQIKEFLEEKGIHVTDIELLTKFFKDESKSYTYRIAIKPSDYEQALKPESWPFRVSVRLFRNKRRNLDQNSWDQQSSRSGGNIQPNMNNQHRRTGVIRRSEQPTENLEYSPIVVNNRFDTPGFEQEVFN